MQVLRMTLRVFVSLCETIVGSKPGPVQRDTVKPAVATRRRQPIEVRGSVGLRRPVLTPRHKGLLFTQDLRMTLRVFVSSCETIVGSNQDPCSAIR